MNLELSLGVGQRLPFGLLRHHGHLLNGTVSKNRHPVRYADSLGSQYPVQVVDSRYRKIAKRDDDVARSQPGVTGRASRFH